MKFPFVTRARHEAEIAEEKHATGYMEQRRNHWCDEVLELRKKAHVQAQEMAKLQAEHETLGHEMLERIVARNQCEEKYRKLLDDCRTVMATNEDLNQRLARFLPKRGPNGKFISKETKP